MSQINTTEALTSDHDHFLLLNDYYTVIIYIGRCVYLLIYPIHGALFPFRKSRVLIASNTTKKIVIIRVLKIPISTLFLIFE